MRKHYHFIGIGGTGLSAIARVLLEQGNTVSGSDLLISQLAEELQSLGAVVYAGHEAEHVSGADMVIRSSAIKDDNVEVKAAQAAGIPVLKRVDFLQELIQDHTLIAVAGTHGKTTTTAMTAWVLDQFDMDPSYIIGGTSKNLKSNAHAGKGKYFVIEADEYDFMFLGLAPDYLILTNVEYDHPDCYPTHETYVAAFKKLILKMKADSTLLVYADHPQTRELGKWAEQFEKVLFYGSATDATYCIENIREVEKQGVCFDLLLPDGEKVEQTLSLPGNHNAWNAAAVLALINQMGLSIEQASHALENFSGTGRRFDTVDTVLGITLIDDYGHHPTEIRSTLQAARGKYPHERIIAVWQPHTYTRTQELFNDFLDAFNECDMVIVTEIYASREKPQDYSAALIASQIHAPDVHFIAQLQDVTAFLLKELKAGDVVVILSAGDANQINQEVSSSLHERRDHA